ARRAGASRRTQGPCPDRGNPPAPGLLSPAVPFTRERRSRAMFFSLWRRLRNRNPGPSRGNPLQGGRHPSYRPRLESLEDRVLPAGAAGGVFAPVLGPSVVSGLQQTGIKSPGGQITVTVAE